jgi:uncharacterized membrane protein
MRLMPVHKLLMRSFAGFGVVLAGINAWRLSVGAPNAAHLLGLGIAIAVLCIAYLRFAPHLREKA